MAFYLPSDNAILLLLPFSYFFISLGGSLYLCCCELKAVSVVPLSYVCYSFRRLCLYCPFLVPQRILISPLEKKDKQAIVFSSLFPAKYKTQRVVVRFTAPALRCLQDAFLLTSSPFSCSLDVSCFDAESEALPPA